MTDRPSSEHDDDSNDIWLPLTAPQLDRTTMQWGDFNDKASRHPAPLLHTTMADQSSSYIPVNLKDEWSSDTLGAFGQDPDKKAPFKVRIFPNLLDDSRLAKLRDEVNSLVELEPKDNDLYKFKQSKDLCEVMMTTKKGSKNSQNIRDFVQVMKDTVREHLERLTGKELSTSHFDITASRYDTGNYLLCHNDQDNLDRYGRALAFVYYLNTRPWTEDDGGALILYNSDASGEPVEINNSIPPRPNTLVVFETTPVSWHSVQEVFCKDDVRLSINGWFHYEGLDRAKKAVSAEKSFEPCPYTLLQPVALDQRVEKFFNECVNQDYLMNKTCAGIRRQFKRESEINLVNFLVTEKFNEICDALKEAACKHKNGLVLVGPYNKRHYKRFNVDELPDICKDLYDAFRSEFFFMLLSRLTALDLQPPSIIHNENEKELAQANTLERKKRATDEKECPSSEKKESTSSSSSSSSSGEDEDEEEEDSSAGDSSADDDDDNNESDGMLETVESETKDDDEVAPDAEKRRGQADGAKKREMSVGDDGPTTSQSASPKRESPRKRKRTSDPLMRMELRHLEPGSYTLIHDHAFELGEKSALDVILHFNHDYKVNFEDGGFISYIDGAPDEDLHDMDDELLTVEPKSNSLSLVYRQDGGTCRFLKYITRAHRSEYQDLYGVYYERPDDLPNRPSD